MTRPSAANAVDVRTPLFNTGVANAREAALRKEIAGVTILSAGIIGAAITLFANLLAPLDMADWAWWIVQNWQDAAPALWDRIAAWFGLSVPSLLVPPLNLAAFLLLTSVGVRLRDHRRSTTLNFPFRQFIGGGIVLFAMGYILVAAPAYSASAGEVPPEAPLTIFLAAAAASFSSLLAGRGNLIRRLWYVVGSLGVLLAANELTKLLVTS